MVVFRKTTSLTSKRSMGNNSNARWLHGRCLKKVQAMANYTLPSRRRSHCSTEDLNAYRQ